jgi:glycosyltransferase involved in cell wall biosynthesis
MNIGVDVRSLLEKERSGVGEYTFQLLDALFGIDKENQYFLFYNSFRKVDDLLPKEWKNFSNVKFCGFHWPNKLLNFCFKFLKWPKIDRMINKNLDIFFIPNLNFISLSSGIKKIITVHDLSFLCYQKFFSRKRRLWHWFVNPRKLISDADKVIAVSENTKRDVAEFCGVAPGKIEVIYSGVRSGGDSPDIGAVKKKYNLPENFILSLGTLEPRKNIEGLIRAFEILKQSSKFQVLSFKLIIVGPKGWLYKKIIDCAKKSPAREDIKFINYINPEEKSAFYKLAKIFVYPSFYEGFGFPPLEAAAAGTPVITSTASSLPEIMGEAALMVDPYNPAELAKVMAECLADENLRNALIEKGKKQAEKFSWGTCAADASKLFE